MTPDAIAAAFHAACLAEIEAPKPGNVHVFAGGHDMEARHFLDAAATAAPFIANPALTVGERIRRAVAASLDVAGTNTNLGIVLLCAPLAAAAEQAGETGGDLWTALAHVLDGLDVGDAEGAYAAIAAANPGGLGKLSNADVRDPPRITLREAMAQAAGRDRIARAYATGYADVRAIGLPALEAAGGEPVAPWWPATAVYLGFLTAFPDSHVERKWGREAALWVLTEARALAAGLAADAPAAEERLARLLQFDRAIKAQNLNPGTSADLTVATIFAAMIDPILRKAVDNG
jgi:triphosphoribosyl-dephospho-CoA synthase